MSIVSAENFLIVNAMEKVEKTETHGEVTPKTRRDFIFVATGAVAGIGALAITRPLLGHMSPAADSIASSGLDVDVSLLHEGQDLLVLVKGDPVLIRHRTPEEIFSAQRDDYMLDLRDPATDQSRLNPKPDGTYDPRYLVLSPRCPHFGSIVVSEAGRFDGFYCPSHGAHFDSSGRIRSAPVVTNLSIPPYYWLSDTALRLQFV